MKLSDIADKLENLAREIKEEENRDIPKIGFRVGNIVELWGAFDYPNGLYRIQDRINTNTGFQVVLKNLEIAHLLLEPWNVKIGTQVIWCEDFSTKTYHLGIIIDIEKDKDSVYLDTCMGKIKQPRSKIWNIVGVS